METIKLTCEKARELDILDILKKNGRLPIRETNNDIWFLSPFRKESKASFKVSKKLNRWYDHGQGKGGNAIDLVMELYNYSVKEALVFLNTGSSSFHQHKISKSYANSPNYSITKISSLNNRALQNYLQFRKIKISIAKKYCNEIYYKMGTKNYFAISFKNNSDGFEIRNKYFKGCLGKKDITTIENKESKSVLIFEGFFDFLSYISMNKKTKNNVDYIILNSINMINKVNIQLKKYKSVFSYLDNDSPGKNGLKILHKYHNDVIDMSFTYSNHNDLNEWLMDKNK